MPEETPVTAPTELPEVAPALVGEAIPDGVQAALQYLQQAFHFVEVTYGFKVGTSIQLRPVTAPAEAPTPGV